MMRVRAPGQLVLGVASSTLQIDAWGGVEEGSAVLPKSCVCVCVEDGGGVKLMAYLTVPGRLRAKRE